MAKRPLVQALGNLTSESTAVQNINENVNKLADAIQDLLSTTALTSNTMNVPLDMNGQRIINLPIPLLSRDPARLQDIIDLQKSFQDIVINPTLENLGITSIINAATTFVRTGTGAISRSLLAKILTDTDISPYDFGAKGDGVTDDTIAFQNALNAAAGKTLSIKGRFVIGTVTVPAGTALVGDQGIYMYRYADPFYEQYANSIILKPNAQINISRGGRYANFAVLRQGLCTPGTALDTAAKARTAIAAFNGIAFYGKGFDVSDNTYSNLTIIGHLRAMFLDGFPGSTQPDPTLSACRSVFEHILIDCTNGIYTNWIPDVPRFFCCHAWPILGYIPGVGPSTADYDILQRSGTAFEIATACDWAQYLNCFAYGYAYGYVNDGTSNIQYVGCQADNVAITAPPAGGVLYKQAGWVIRNNVEHCSLINCTVISYDTGVLVAYNINGSANDVSKRQTVQVIGGRYICNTYNFDLAAGNVTIDKPYVQALRPIRVRGTMGNVNLEFTDIGDANAKIGTVVTVEAGYSGYMNVDNKSSPDSYNTFITIPDTILRNGRVFVKGAGSRFGYTPGAVTSSGAATFAGTAGSFSRLDNRVATVTATTTISAVGTGTGSVRIDLPFPAAAGRTQYLTGSREAVGGQLLKVVINPGTSYADCLLFDNSSPIAANAVINIHGLYEHS